MPYIILILSIIIIISSIKHIQFIFRHPQAIEVNNHIHLVDYKIKYNLLNENEKVQVKKYMNTILIVSYFLTSIYYILSAIYINNILFTLLTALLLTMSIDNYKNNYNIVNKEHMIEEMAKYTWIDKITFLLSIFYVIFMIIYVVGDIFV